MISHKLAPLGRLGFQLFKPIVKSKFSNLHDVLNMLMDLDVKDAAASDLRYSAVHLVPCFTDPDPTRVAIVQYNDDDNELESNSYIVSFTKLEDLVWNLDVNDNWIFWTESE